MKTKVEQISQVKRKLSVEIEPEEVERRLNEFYQELRKKVRIKGFRPGKVPIRILEARFGNLVKEEVIQNIIRDTLPEATKKLDRLPLGIPSLNFDKDSFKRGSPFTYEAEVEVKPDIEVSDYIGIELKKPEVKVTEDMIKREIDKLREMHGELVSVKEDRPIKMGDYVVLSYRGFYKGKPMEELTKENAIIKIGGRDTHPLFEAALVGLKKGEEKRISVDFEENYPNPNLAGKSIKFDVRIIDIKEMKLPELTDEFVKEKFKAETVEKFKEDIRKRLIEQEEKKAEFELKRQILDKLVEKVQVELPKVLVDAELEQMVEGFKNDLKKGGSSLEEFGLTEEKIRKDFRPAAERRVKEMLILEKIAEKEGISVSDEEVEEEIKKTAQAIGEEPERLKKIYEERRIIDYLRIRLRDQKTLNYLLQNAKIKEAKEEKDADSDSDRADTKR